MLLRLNEPLPFLALTTCGLNNLEVTIAASALWFITPRPVSTALVFAVFALDFLVIYFLSTNGYFKLNNKEAFILAYLRGGDCRLNFQPRKYF
ncbi:MAG: hypothetical protein ACI8ZA_002573 [Gammaproteobacteria bacterium]